MKSLGKSYIIFGLKFALLFWLFSLFRVLFYLFNSNYFPQPEAINFIGGLRFDWITITILYLPFFVSLWFFPRSNTVVQKVLFLFSTTLAIASNFLDFEYFKFTQKRTTADLFTTKGIEEDVFRLLPQFVADYWYLGLLAMLCFWLVKVVYEKIDKIETKRLTWKAYLIFSLPVTVLTFIGFRGGVQLKPLNVIQASQYAKAQNIPLVTNTSFTLIKSTNKESIVVKNYFEEEALSSIYSPIQKFSGDSISKQLNVVLIIAESFSQEYIGFYNNGKGYTPFLDSLLNESIVFKNAFANGKKSIEALPAILSSIPTLSNTSYISSKYGGNTIESLPRTLKKQGYSSAFYHGGANGTMGFQAFTQIAGIDNYYGKADYPNEGDFDGNWGIFDEPYLQYCVDQFSNMPAPFFSGIFTLSSHHPYTIPDQYIGKFPKGVLPIHESIGYSDYALKQFFATAKETTWFENTLFIITADHTQANVNQWYNNPVGMYRVPIAYYCPKYLSDTLINTITQQVDIYPTTLDLLGIDNSIVSFGQSAFDENIHFAVSYLNGIYQLTSDDYCLQFNGDKTIGFYNWKKDNALVNNLIDSKETNVKATLATLEEQLKAYLQQYRNRIVNNKLTYDGE
ncbi:MAG: phosphoglycerol transferase MdoB-like AlkP superfamily enzyme [Vicingaceae bacterium]|jgi:phosphoglycerol transferase MdoB-like AlkP superfamily enzyme